MAGSNENLAYLRRALVSAWATIQQDGIELPEEAVMPEVKRRALPKIGTLTLQRTEIESRQLRTTAEVKAAAAELVVAPRAAPPARTRPSAPPIDDSLVNKPLRFVFEMTYREKGKKSVKGLFECPGRIARVSDAYTRVGGKRLGAGFAYVEWSDHTTSWQLLRPGFYGQHRAAGWRIPRDDEDATLDDEFEFEDDSNDSGSESEHNESSSDDDDDMAD